MRVSYSSGNFAIPYYVWLYLPSSAMSGVQRGALLILNGSPSEDFVVDQHRQLNTDTSPQVMRNSDPGWVFAFLGTHSETS